MSFNYEQVKDILVCPVTRDELVHEESALVSVNPERRLSYPIVDDIPRLLEDEATELSVEECVLFFLCGQFCLFPLEECFVITGPIKQLSLVAPGCSAAWAEELV